MFGRKQQRILQLKIEADVARAAYDLERSENTRKIKVISDLNSAILKLVNQNRDYEARVEALDYALSESKGLNQALEEENKDLVRQVELLQSVLGQLSVQVKLPTRKK